MTRDDYSKLSEEDRMRAAAGLLVGVAATQAPVSSGERPLAYPVLGDWSGGSHVGAGFGAPHRDVWEAAAHVEALEREFAQFLQARSRAIRSLELLAEKALTNE